MKTHTKTLIEALRILSRDIQSEDGVANAAIAEAADRLEQFAGLRVDVCAASNMSIIMISKPIEHGFETTTLGDLIDLRNKQEETKP